MTVALLLTTVGDAAQAERLARLALEARLAACVQSHAVESWYEWQGHLQHDIEWRLLFKTTPTQQAALMALLQREHPYELPALLSVAADATPEFDHWVQAETAPR